jgi:MFS family permease
MSIPEAFRRAAYGFRALRNRNYRLFWFGQMVSVAGTWMQDTALALLVLHLTNSPFALGLTMTIRFLPALFLSLYGGVIADRLPKRTTLIVTQTFQLVIALALAVLTSTDAITVEIIYVMAALRGLVDAIDMPTRQAFTVEMAGAEDLPNAVALNSAQFNTARIVGPSLAALVITTAGTAVCFYVNAASFLAVIGAYVLMREAELFPAPRAARQGALRQVGQGLRYAVKTPDILVILVVMAAIGTFGYNFSTIFPLVNEYVLHGGAPGLSLLLALSAVGSVIAGLFTAYAGRPSQRRLLVSAGVFTVLLFLLGLSHWRPVTWVLAFLIGLVSIIFMTSANTRLQLVVRGEMRGRVMGMYALLFVGTTPIGSLLVGTLAGKNGVRVPDMVLEMAAVCAVGVLVAIWFALRRRAPTQAGENEDADAGRTGAA